MNVGSENWPSALKINLFLEKGGEILIKLFCLKVVSLELVVSYFLKFSLRVEKLAEGTHVHWPYTTVIYSALVYRVPSSTCFLNF